jgi:hypothetical protein
MGKAGGDGVGVARGRCCLGFRECFGLGAVSEELLAFGFVVAGDGRNKGRGGNISVMGGRDQETEREAECGLAEGLE